MQGDPPNISGSRTRSTRHQCFNHSRHHSSMWLFCPLQKSQHHNRGRFITVVFFPSPIPSPIIGHSNRFSAVSWIQCPGRRLKDLRMVKRVVQLSKYFPLSVPTTATALVPVNHPPATATEGKHKFARSNVLENTFNQCGTIWGFGDSCISLRSSPRAIASDLT